MPAATLKSWLKTFLENRGLYVRKIGGLARGADLFIDLARLGFSPDGVVFDVGAHKGETAALFKEVWSSAAVFSFEPVAENHRALSRRVAAFPDVRCFHTALGASPGTAIIHLGSDSQTHRIDGNPDGAGGSSRTESVAVTTLDAVVAEEGVRRIPLLKIDAEGYEIPILEGARRTFEAGLVDWIFVEATLDPGDTLHTPLATLQTALGAHGFHLVALYDQMIWNNPLRMAYANALFRRAEHR